MSDTSKLEHGYDPGREHLGEVYAKALLGATEKTGSSEAVLLEFHSFLADVLDKLPQFKATLFSLRVAHEDKVKLLDKAFAGKMSPQLLTFLKVLSQHNRFDCARLVYASAKKQLDKLRGRVEVLVTSAAPINNQLIEQIKTKLTALLKHEVQLQVKVDADLLGGLIVRVGDKVYDSSVATQLKKMKDVALDRTEQQIRQSLGRFVATSAT